MLPGSGGVVVLMFVRVGPSASLGKLKDGLEKRNSFKLVPEITEPTT